MRDYRLYLKDILAAMDSIEAFVAGMDLETFQADDKSTSAVIRKFEIIGEASRQIPEEMRQAYPQVPWKEMAGMRDKVSHFYFGVDREAVWYAVKERIPALRPVIEKILSDLGGQQK